MAAMGRWGIQLSGTASMDATASNVAIATASS